MSSITKRASSSKGDGKSDLTSPAGAKKKCRSSYGNVTERKKGAAIRKGRFGLFKDLRNENYVVVKLYNILTTEEFDLKMKQFPEIVGIIDELERNSLLTYDNLLVFSNKPENRVISKKDGKLEQTFHVCYLFTLTTTFIICIYILREYFFNGCF